MPVTGMVGNANLMDDTAPAHIYEGYDFFKKLSRENGLPLKFITVPAPLSQQIDSGRFACPVLVIHRQLMPPWRQARAFRNPVGAAAAGSPGAVTRGE